MNSMTNRERIRAVLDGKTVDRFPVWLKMTNRTWQGPQPEPYRSMNADELLRAAGCDLVLGNGIHVRRNNPHVTTRNEEWDGILRSVFTTPDGDLISEETYDPYTQSRHPTRFPINNRKELQAARWLFQETTYEVTPDDAEKSARRQKQLVENDAFSHSGVGPGPLMNLVEHLAGPVTTVFLLHDHPDLFRQTIALMHSDRMRMLEAMLPATAADSVWLTENTSTTLISPAQFREFCVPYLRDCGNMILEHGLIPVHHMCGTLNALLEDIDRLPASANEAYTTPPVGDCTLAEGRRRMPSKTLIGGTNATLLTRPLEKIEEDVGYDLKNCPDTRGIFLTSAGVLPALVSFEKAKKITAILKSMPMH